MNCIRPATGPIRRFVIPAEHGESRDPLPVKRDCASRRWTPAPGPRARSAQGSKGWPGCQPEPGSEADQEPKRNKSRRFVGGVWRGRIHLSRPGPHAWAAMLRLRQSVRHSPRDNIGLGDDAAAAEPIIIGRTFARHATPRLLWAYAVRRRLYMSAFQRIRSVPPAPAEPPSTTRDFRR